MNFLQLILKQMRQRALSTWLTLLSVILGVGLAVAIMVFQREGEKLFGQSDFGYDLIVGPKGSPLQLVLNTVYGLDQSPGNIPYGIYEDLSRPRHLLVRAALPFAVGDTFEGYRVIGTLPHAFPVDHEGNRIDGDKEMDLSRVYQYRQGRQFSFREGRPFHPEKFEAVIGADVFKSGKLKFGDKFKVAHGGGGKGASDDVHDEQWTVVGVLDETMTASDKAIYIPLTSFYAIPKHTEALEAFEALRQRVEATQLGAKPTTAPATRPAQAKVEEKKDDHEGHDHAYHLHEDGTIHLELPKNEWMVSAIAVRTRSAFGTMNLMWGFANDPLARASAVSPAMEMRKFYDTFLKGSSLLLLGISLIVTIVAAVSILVSIYNSVSARLKEIAILRALGATRARVLALICLEALIIGIVGGVLGLIVGHLLAGAGSAFLKRLLGEGIQWVAIGRYEWVYLGVVAVLAVLAGLVPAMKAYRTPVATNLVSG